MNRKRGMGSKKQVMNGKSMGVTVSPCESSSNGVNSQKKWSALPGPQKYIWDMTAMINADGRNPPREGAVVLWRQMSQFMRLVNSRGWHTAQY